MEKILILLVILACVWGICLILYIIHYLYFAKKINGKEHIEKYMSEKYGEDWLEQCMNGLRDPSVRKSIADELKLK
jgi:hypothetical protein